MKNNLSFCSLTGATNHIDPLQLLALSEEFGNVEWAILFSWSRMGTGRYPTLAWIENASNTLSGKAKIALHLCGKSVFDFLDKNQEVWNISQKFDRVQLNFNGQKTPVNTQILNEVIKEFPGIVITQHNQANQEIYKDIDAINHQVLFDASGGFGKAPEQWLSPLKDKVCGYAGGLSPENVESNLHQIIHLNQNTPFWIDMESSLHIDEKFSLDRCQELLQQVKEFGG